MGKVTAGPSATRKLAPLAATVLANDRSPLTNVGFFLASSPQANTSGSAPPARDPDDPDSAGANDNNNNDEDDNNNKKERGGSG